MFRHLALCALLAWLAVASGADTGADPCADIVKCVGDCRVACNIKSVKQVQGAFTSDVSHAVALKVLEASYDHNGSVVAVPIGTFSGINTIGEYIAMFTSSKDNVGLATLFSPVNATVVDLSAFGDQVSATVDIQVHSMLESGVSTTLRAMAFHKMTNASKIVKHLLYFTDFGDFLANLKLPKALSTPEALKKHIVMPVCLATQKYCNGTNQQYKSVDECVKFVSSIPAIRGPYRVAGNSGICRLTHSGFLQYDPHHHCPHVGPTGGDQCTEDLPIAAAKINKMIPPGTFTHVPAGLHAEPAAAAAAQQGWPAAVVVAAVAAAVVVVAAVAAVYAGLVGKRAAAGVAAAGDAEYQRL